MTTKNGDNHGPLMGGGRGKCCPFCEALLIPWDGRPARGRSSL
jgi:hypothetical protein